MNNKNNLHSMDLEEAAENYASGYEQVGYDEDQILSVQDAFIDGANWQKKQLIDKACEWLNLFYSEDRHCYLVSEDINEFRKAMED